MTNKRVLRKAGLSDLSEHSFFRCLFSYPSAVKSGAVDEYHHVAPRAGGLVVHGDVHAEGPAISIRRPFRRRFIPPIFRICFWILCPIQEGDDMRGGQRFVRGKMSVVRPGCNPLLHRPEHCFIVIIVRFHIPRTATGRSRPVLSLPPASDRNAYRRCRW